MSVNPGVSEATVDRREETVITQQPGYASTEQSTRDVAAEHRLVFYRIIWIAWTILGILEILLGLRFMLKLIAANAQSGFAALIYNVTAVFTAPFAGIVKTPASGAGVIDVTTLIAMAVYALFFWIVVRVIGIVAERPTSRMATRSVHEQMLDGSNRSTRTTEIS